MIAEAGPTYVSDEFTLPQTPDEVTEWLNDGHTNVRYIDAWKQMSEVYVEAFPNQYISLLEGTGLPINDHGQIDMQQKVRMRRTVVDAVSIILQR